VQVHATNTSILVSQSKVGLTEATTTLLQVPRAVRKLARTNAATVF
jgi:hypothetical protein